MKLAAYDALIIRLEGLAERSPGWYRTRVAVLAAFGFAMVGLALLIGLVLLAAAAGVLFLAGKAGHGAGVFKIAFVLAALGGALAWSVLRGVWVRFPRVDGIALSRAEAPDLFTEVENLRRAVGSPPVHRIVITPEFNAALAQRPRLGLFGWYENQLVLGLPLLRRMDVPQARSVIAHELGHLRGEHGRFGAWIHRLRATWSHLAAQNAGGGVLRAFLNWFAPLFNAYSFVLARLQEREADRVAARAASAAAAATALVRGALIGRHSAGFWEDLGRQALRDQHPPADLLDRLDRFLATPPAQGARWLGEALNRGNDRDDVHPCLRERLEIIGCPAAGRSPNALAAIPASASAAHAWLREREAELAGRLNRAWLAENGRGWAARHRQGVELAARRAALSASREAGAITVDQRWELVDVLHQLDGQAAARPALEELLTAKPDHAPALFLLGRELLADGDARGVPLIEGAIAHDADAAGPGYALLRDFADAQGRRDIIPGIEERAERRSELESLSAAERAQLPSPKRLQAHGLGPAALAPLRATFARHPEIAAVDLAGVAVQHQPDKPYFVVVVRIRVAWWKFRGAAADQQLLATLAQEIVLPGSWQLITGKEATAALAKRAGKQAEARIYTR